MNASSSVKDRPGFSLVELLVVVSLIVIIAGFAIPAVSGVVKGNYVARAGQSLVQQLSLARQQAITRNRRVEVRFYKFDDGDMTGNDQYYRGFQAFLVEEDNTRKPLTKMEKLPGRIVLNESTEASPLLGGTNKVFSNADPQISIPGVGMKYTARSIQFQPGGGTTLMPKANFLSVHEVRVAADARAVTLPADYCVVQVDEANGSTRLYRP